VYLLTRLDLADGTIFEQTNPGLLGLENGWKTVGTEADLAGVAERLRREGWSVSADR
jgi:hypothetical protein